MTVFAVLERNPNPELRKAIHENFDDDYLLIAPGQWLISASGTAQNLSNQLGLSPGRGFSSTVVFATSSYYGLHSTEIWDWIKTKLESET